MMIMLEKININVTHILCSSIRRMAAKIFQLMFKELVLPSEQMVRTSETKTIRVAIRSYAIFMNTTECVCKAKSKSKSHYDR
jgi:hypothetical protein